jgi:hypothetical protein
MVFIILFLQIIPLNQSKIILTNKDINPQMAIQDQWLKNNGFSTLQNWIFTKGILGDNTSVDADISGGKANFRVLGEKLTYSLSGIPNSTNSPDWLELAKPDYYKPDNTGIDNFGCWVSHVWSEGSNQFPGVHWRKNISLDNDMSKYTIKAASIEVTFNATVNANVDVIDESALNQFGIGDFVTFYVQISDLDYKNPYIIAINKTWDLGRDSGPLSISNKLIEAYDESVIITALNSAFDKDPDHSNFTITLGIDIYSEDNWGGDTDTFTSLRINKCNLSFTYERKIEKFTSLALNQIGDTVSGENVRITNAVCYFNYSISDVWVYDLSPFSEMRILINDNPYRETIQLSSMTISSRQARFEGEDFSSLFREEVNISISIQTYIANTFSLNRTITISIDDAYLYISYIFVRSGADYSILVIGLTAGIIGIVIAFSLYQFHFKYPPLVRKIRKLKKGIRKRLVKKPILVNSREDIIQESLNEKKNILEFETLNIEKTNIKEKKSIQKEGEL